MTDIYDNDDARSDAEHITLLRILDTLYMLLWEQNPDIAQRLIDTHAEGGLISAPANLNPSLTL